MAALSLYFICVIIKIIFMHFVIFLSLHEHIEIVSLTDLLGVFRLHCRFAESGESYSYVQRPLSNFYLFNC